MKPINFSIFALLLIISCSNGINTNQNEYEIEIDQSEEVKTQVTNLNDDMFYLIFSNLKFHDLVNMTVAIPEIPAFEMIQRKYSELDILLHYGADLSFDQNKRVEIYDFQLSLTTLKHFGECFQKMCIDYQHFRCSEMPIVTKFLNKYTSKTVTELTMFYPNENVLNHLTVPFEEIQDLTCNIRDLNNIKGSTPWNYLFPKLQRLNIELFSIKNLSFIGFEFPHLEHVTLSIARSTWGKIDMIERLFAKNPQIKSIKLSGFFPTGFLKVIEPLLPDLEILKIRASDIGYKSVHFENVRYFKLDTDYEGYVENIWLPNLESLNMYYSTTGHSAWIDFFKRHNNFSHLILNDFYHQMSRTIGLNAFTADLKNLVDVTVRSYEHFGNEFIIQFIESHKELRKFCASISRGSFTKPMEEALRERFQNEWTITVDRQLCFERKKLM